MAVIPETHKDLLDVPVATLATYGEDGYPQVSALWFLYDEGVVRMSLNETRQKVKNMKQKPEATLFILDPANPYRTLEIRGRVEISNDTPDYAFVERLSAKYGGYDVRNNDKPGEERLVVTLHPVKVNTWG